MFKIISESRSIAHSLEITELEHVSTGARIIFLKNDDNHLSFLMALRTQSLDNKGIAHLVEHLLLRGSKKYSENKYFEFLKNSNYSYLDASTYWDKTIYAASTKQEEELNQIIDFYMNAVFFPDIEDEDYLKKVFNKECYSINDDYVVTGRAYEEMKLKEANINYIIDSYIYKEIMEGTVYSNRPGGESDKILKVSLKDCIQYYKFYYNLENCYIVLYGNLKKDNYLDLLNNYFNKINNHSKYKLTMREDLQVNDDKKIIVYDFKFIKTSIISINWKISIGNDSKLIMFFYIIEKIFRNYMNEFKIRLHSLGIKEIRNIHFMFDHSTYIPTFEIRIILDNKIDYPLISSDKYINVLREIISLITKKDLENIIEEFQREYYNHFNNISYSKGLLLSLDLVTSWLNYGYTSDIFDSICLIKEFNKEKLTDLVEKFLVKNKNVILIFK